MKQLKEIIGKFSAGELTVEAANKALANAGASFRLNPAKNLLSEDEKRATTVGYYPEQANGYGLLDTGTGSLDKVQIQNGHLLNCDCGDLYALVAIAGKTYRVNGRFLTE